MLPTYLKDANSVNDFEVKLKQYKLESIRKDNISGYWELSQEIFGI